MNKFKVRFLIFKSEIKGKFFKEQRINVLYFVKEKEEKVLVLETSGNVKPDIFVGSKPLLKKNPQYKGKLYALYQGVEFKLDS